MIVIYILLSATVFVVMLDFYRRVMRKKHVPASLQHDCDMINNNMIPSRLHSMIPFDYEEREDWRMSSSINHIFVDGGKEPMWCLSVHLHNNRNHSSFTVPYDHTGEIYDY